MTATTPHPATTRVADRHVPLVDLAALALLAGALRVPALLADRHLTFDDGVYGASAVAMRAGGVPFREVFSSQGPVFLPLVRLADLAGMESMDAPRLVGLVSGVLFTLAVYLTARELTDRLGALVGAVLATCSGSILWVTGPIASDGPALAAATTALWLSLRWRRVPSPWGALGLGLAVGAALGTKLTTLPVLVPVGIVLIAAVVPGRDEAGRLVVDGEGLRMLLLAAGAAVVVSLVPTTAFGIADVWDQSVVYHQEVTTPREPLANASKVISTFVDRDLALALSAVLVLVWQLAVRPDVPRPAAAPGGDGGVRAPARPGRLGRLANPTLVWVWLGATALMLLAIHPLWRPHVSGLVPPVALLVGCYRPPPQLVAVAAFVLVAVTAWRVDDLLMPDPYEGESRVLQARLAELPAGAWVISDEPGQVWRAGRRTPDDLVDASILRIDADRLTSESLATAANDPHVCAVVVWSGVRFGSFTDLDDRLAAHGFEPTGDFEEPRELYLRSTCDPPS
jgi:4-amino-4-deoxy-L-arabinose transferase-like glycosyltransferase